jgi:DNA-binding transcriptional ArsR family regulator
VSGTHRFTARLAVVEDQSLSEGARLVYIVLDEYARTSDTCWPSQATLGKRLGMPLRTVRHHLLKLSRAGVIEKRRKHVMGAPNEYVLTARSRHRRRTPADCPERPDRQAPVAAPDRQTFAAEEPAVLIYEEEQMQGGDYVEPQADIAPPEAAPGKEEPSPSVELVPVVPVVSPEQFAEESVKAELTAAYDRHLKHHRSEPRTAVLLKLIGQSRRGEFDWTKFRENHEPWCDFQRRNGWQYCSLTLLAWIRAGMPPPPQANQKVGFSEGVARAFRRRFEEGLL